MSTPIPLPKRIPPYLHRISDNVDEYRSWNRGSVKLSETSLESSRRGWSRHRRRRKKIMIIAPTSCHPVTGQKSVVRGEDDSCPDGLHCRAECVAIDGLVRLIRVGLNGHDSHSRAGLVACRISGLGMNNEYTAKYDKPIDRCTEYNPSRHNSESCCIHWFIPFYYLQAPFVSTQRP